MQIVGLSQKLPELGRIRTGFSTPTQAGKKRPQKASEWILTSTIREHLDQAVGAFGGHVKPWEEQPGTFKCLLATNVIPVIVPPGTEVSTAYEAWTAGGVSHRCNGVYDFVGGRVCDCGERNDSPAERDRAEMVRKSRGVKLTTTLSVVLPFIDGIGTWRLVSHSFYAAQELGGMASVLAAASAQGIYLDAFLRLEQRTSKSGGKTQNYAVPVLDVRANMAELLAGGVPTRPAIAAAPQPVREVPNMGDAAPNNRPTVDPENPFGLGGQDPFDAPVVKP